MIWKIRKGKERLAQDSLVPFWTSIFFFFFFLPASYFYSFFLICSEFCHTLKWNGLEFTCLPHPRDQTHISYVGRWIFLLSRQVDSLSLNHQGSPLVIEARRLSEPDIWIATSFKGFCQEMETWGRWLHYHSEDGIFKSTWTKQKFPFLYEKKKPHSCLTLGGVGISFSCITCQLVTLTWMK